MIDRQQLIWIQHLNERNKEKPLRNIHWNQRLTTTGIEIGKGKLRMIITQIYVGK